MVFKMWTLIVEDDQNEQESWNDAFDLHNASKEMHGFEVKHEFAATLEEAREKIAERNYDAAVVDLRLRQQDGRAAPNTDGTTVRDEILESEMAVVAMFTGEDGAVQAPKADTKVVKTFRKGGGEGEGTGVVMDWLRSQVPMLKHIRAAQSSIQQEMANIFTQSIWPRWANWADTDSVDVSQAITRHITSHVYAVLQEKGNQKAHPEEWYFVPAIREGVRTGDLFKTQDNSADFFEVVITPRCDLARNPQAGDTIQLARCEDISALWEPEKAKLDAAIAAQKASNGAGDQVAFEKRVAKAKTEVRKFTQHCGKTYWHFLPQLRIGNDTAGPFMVRFDVIRTVPRNPATETEFLASRIAAVTPEFLPSLVERLGAYFSRIGTPDYSHPE